MKTKRIFGYLAMVAIACFMTACGGDDVDPNDPSPNDKIKDPEGTVTITMHNENSGETWLDYFYIDKGNNFEGSYSWFCDYGEVAGLGNVAKIPKAGWASTVAVKPGHGYVAYDSSNDFFYRMYVVRYITNVYDEIIGAEVKYQKPFYGVDEMPTIEKTEINIPTEATSYTETINFTNTTIIPCTVKCVEEIGGNLTVRWFFSDNKPYIYISYSKSKLEDFEYAEIECTTYYGKTITLYVRK